MQKEEPMNEPHGGWLVSRLVNGNEGAALEAEAPELPILTLNPFELSDLEMLAIGGFRMPFCRHCY